MYVQTGASVWLVVRTWCPTHSQNTDGTADTARTAYMYKTRTRVRSCICTHITPAHVVALRSDNHLRPSGPISDRVARRARQACGLLARHPHSEGVGLVIVFNTGAVSIVVLCSASLHTACLEGSPTHRLSIAVCGQRRGAAEPH